MFLVYLSTFFVHVFKCTPHRNIILKLLLVISPWISIPYFEATMLALASFSVFYPPFMYVTIPLKLYIKKHGLIALDTASYQPATDSQKDHNGE